MSAAAPTPSGAPRRFAPRPVPLEEFPALVSATGTLLAAAPGRLCVLFLLVFLPIQFIPNLPYVAMPLRATLAAVGFAGFYAALESARMGRPATFVDMLLPWRLAPDKLLVLAASGLVPLALALLAWWADIGGDELDRLLVGGAADGGPGVRQQVEFVVVINLAAMPVIFLQPLAVLFHWSGSRTIAATLIAWLANWRWALILTLVSIPIAIGLDSFDSSDALEILMSLVSEIAVEIALSAFTLVLLQRSLK